MKLTQDQRKAIKDLREAATAAGANLYLYNEIGGWVVLLMKKGAGADFRRATGADGYRLRRLERVGDMWEALRLSEGRVRNAFASMIRSLGSGREELSPVVYGEMLVELPAELEEPAAPVEQEQLEEPAAPVDQEELEDPAEPVDQEQLEERVRIRARDAARADGGMLLGLVVDRVSRWSDEDRPRRFGWMEAKALRLLEEAEEQERRLEAERVDGSRRERAERLEAPARDLEELNRRRAGRGLDPMSRREWDQVSALRDPLVLHLALDQVEAMLSG